MEENNSLTKEYKLTQYSRSAGCGCKIAPAILEEIIKSNNEPVHFQHLLTDNRHNEDAAAYDLGNGSALLSTTDFFMPVVDDAYQFGRIAAANSISDIYAMGGRPVMALAILGWPVETLPISLARLVTEGARAMCAEAGIPLAGGHSVDTTEPVFGLSVNGICNISNIKKNNTARPGDLLFLTKPLGMGILATAHKRGVLLPHHYNELIKTLTTLNSIGAQLGSIAGVTAMTDVTGFGLAGHLVEMAEGCGAAAVIHYSRLPVADGIRQYLAQRIVPDATYRNWNAYHSKIGFEPGVDVMEAFNLLPDPQTNGGLLVAVSPDAVPEVMDTFSKNGLSHFATPIGTFISHTDKTIIVMP